MIYYFGLKKKSHISFAIHVCTASRSKHNGGYINAKMITIFQHWNVILSFDLSNVTILTDVANFMPVENVTSQLYNMVIVLYFF